MTPPPAARSAVAAADRPARPRAPGPARIGRLLVVVNPSASGVSPRRRELAVRALRERWALTVVDTDAQGHATALCEEARDDGYEAVVALGGDGTAGEAASGLAGSATPLACLPGGCTNVFCRTLRVPADLEAASRRLAARAGDLATRRIDLGTMNGRHFLFASGIGVTASLMEHADRHPRLKARLGQHYFLYAALAAFGTPRRGPRLPRVRVSAGGRSGHGVTAIVQNSEPLTWIAGRPVRVCEGAGLETGSISLVLGLRARPLEVADLLGRLVTGERGWVLSHPQIESFPVLRGARVESADGRPFPVELDGSFAGVFHSVEYGVAPAALSVVS